MNQWERIKSRYWQRQMEKGLQQWRETVQFDSDLVCLDCFSQGPWTFLYVPLYQSLGRSSVPMVAACACGGCLTLEEAVRLRTINHELKACFASEPIA